MNTIETALRSYRHLLAHKHPEETKQAAYADEALKQLKALAPYIDAGREQGPDTVRQEASSGRELLIGGQTARIIIKNTHALLRHKCRKSPLWSMVSNITGHGSGYSWDVCVSANLDPGQDCGVAHLKDCSDAAAAGREAT